MTAFKWSLVVPHGQNIPQEVGDWGLILLSAYEGYNSNLSLPRAADLFG